MAAQHHSADDIRDWCQGSYPLQCCVTKTVSLHVSPQILPVTLATIT